MIEASHRDERDTIGGQGMAVWGGKGEKHVPAGGHGGERTLEPICGTRTAGCYTAWVGHSKQAAGQVWLKPTGERVFALFRPRGVISN